MHEYDVTLKSLLTRPGGTLLAGLTGLSVERWLNVELPEVRNLRVDLLGETALRELVQIEFQRANDSEMMWRMAEYAFSIRRQYGRWPAQFVLYVGQTTLRMPDRVESPSLSFRCRIVDIRGLDAEPLLSSPHLEDNIVAVLTRLRDERESVKRILSNIAGCDPARRSLAMKELTLLAGLRKLETVIRQEAAKMPILDDIMEHDLFGPAIRQGRAEGREEGREEGERRVVLSQIRKRFGPVPSWAEQRLTALNAPDLEQIALRLLDARNLEELLG